MKKILLIEDRIERMKKFSSVNLFDNNIVEVITGNDYDNFIINIIENNFSLLDNYHCIISHKSALTIVQRDKIKNHCEFKKKPLVLFSGGISYSFYNDDSFPYLNINASDFYSSKLKIFLDSLKETNTINLPILQFGENWKLNKLLNFRNDLIKKINEMNLKRVRDLNLDEALKGLFLKDSGFEFISNDFSGIDNVQSKRIKIKIDQLIHELI